MSDDISQELRAFEGSEALANGDFSVCIRGADRIKAQAARIAELEAKNKMIADYIACDCDSFDDCFNDVSSQDKCPCFIVRAALAGGKDE